ncbi:hypothetical protein BZL30_5882 [Mycobacterium kansasii]|uniref:Transmembrane protein n=1 Tax=Mycobacterium kansasii TaxID=1768 RepID=A0A1V3WZC7_MYCKA|nr:hypothetical protein BZL30_5882 [Mycobacterium kansasii]
MLEQIESALYAEDPKFASSVRGGGFRAPTARRRLQGAALFVIGLAMLVSGVAFKATMIGSFPILSVFGFVVMFGGVVYAITAPRLPGRLDHSRPASGGRASVAVKAPEAHSPAGWRIGSGAASTSRRTNVDLTGQPPAAPFFVRTRCPAAEPPFAGHLEESTPKPSRELLAWSCPTAPHLAPHFRPLASEMRF